MAIFVYPPAGSTTVTIPAIGTNGALAPTSSIEVAGVGPDGNLHPISTDNSGNQNVNVLSSALPTGASTAANQATANGSLSSIDTKTPALQSGNVPVQLPASQVSALTPPTTVTVVQPTGSNLNAAVTGAVTLNTGSNAIGSVSVSNFPSTQAVSGNVSVSNFPAVQAVSLGGLNNQTGSAAALNADAITSLDVSSYGSLSAQILGTFTGTLTFQGSNDNVNFVSVNAQSTANGTTAVVQTATTVGMYVIPVEFRYFRLRMTAYTSGTATANLSAFAQPVQDMGQRSVVLATGSTTSISSATNVTLNALPTGSNTIGGVNIVSRQGTLTDASGSTSATASTSTQIFAALATRKYLLIQNLSTTAAIYLNFTSAATTGTGSLYIAPQGSFVFEGEYVSTEAVNVLSATASVPFTAKQG